MNHPREEVAAAANRFADANVRAEEERDWSPLADFYTDDAVYTYVGLSSNGLVEARGKEEIRRIVMGRDMQDYAGWTFPFQWIVIDGNRVVTRWSNRAPERRADGSVIECPGMSVLEYAGDGKFKSQFNLYDRLSVKAVLDEAAAIRGDAGEATDMKPQKKKAKKKAGKKKKKPKAKAKGKKKSTKKAAGKGTKKPAKKASGKARKKAAKKPSKGRKKKPAKGRKK